MSSPKPWAELIQLVPIISLAFPIVTSGEVDLANMGGAFAVSTGLAIGVYGLLWWRAQAANPILVGTTVWLAAGAIAFALPIAPLADLIARTQALGLFVCALGAGLVTIATSDAGYIGCPHPDPSWVRRSSMALLGLTALVVAWAFAFRHDVRIGGGLPFIVLNVTRRVLIAKRVADDA